MKFKLGLLLLIMTASSAIGQEEGQGGLPLFSWDRVPVSVHFGIGEGLTSEEYDFIADHFNFITLTAGPLPKTSKGSAELYTARAARAIKKRNPQAKVLFYWASDKPKHQSKISNQAYPGEYIIQTQKRNGKKDRVIKWFDLSRKEVQDWWSDAAGDAVHKYACDGIFVDGATAGTPGGSLSRVVGEIKAADMDEALFAMLKEAKKKMGPDKLIIFNPLHGHDGKRPQLGQEYLPLTDGAMVDDFDRLRAQSKEYMANTIKTMREAGKSGKVIVFKGWPRFLSDWRAGKMKNISHEEVLSRAQKDVTFSLACFLIGAEQNCYFCYSWGWTAHDGSLDSYAFFDKPLGPPQGDAVQQGWTFKREFKHASVLVNLENRTAKIDLR
ncbi:MAG: putative glycoside hydrolase [Mariniblastus sp.]|nr:putative glycoside hydrolase [Mariniblastus sp.]